MISSETVRKTVLTKTRNDLKQPTICKKRPETTNNDLHQVKNDLKRPTTSKTVYNDPNLQAKKDAKRPAPYRF